MLVVRQILNLGEMPKFVNFLSTKIPEWDQFGKIWIFRKFSEYWLHEGQIPQLCFYFDCSIVQNFNKREKKILDFLF